MAEIAAIFLRSGSKIEPTEPSFTIILRNTRSYDFCLRALILRSAWFAKMHQKHACFLFYSVCFFCFQGYGWLRHNVGNWRPKGHCLRVRHPHLPYLRPPTKALESALLVKESQGQLFIFFAYAFFCLNNVTCYTASKPCVIDTSTLINFFSTL